MGYYPIALELAGSKCLIVGGGEVALRKAEALAEAGAQVSVVAPEVDPGIEKIDHVQIERRAYRAGDESGCALVFAATDDRSVNSEVAAEARRAGIPVNVADDPELCSFIVPSVLRRGEMLIAVTTSGRSPALAKRIRQELEERFGPEYAGFVELLGELRETVKARYPNQRERQAAFDRLIDCGILELLREGKAEEAREKALSII